MDVDKLILEENIDRIPEEFAPDLDEAEINELFDSFMQNAQLMINDNDKEL